MDKAIFACWRGFARCAIEWMGGRQVVVPTELNAEKNLTATLIVEYAVSVATISKSIGQEVP